ncbi:PEP/pyruvate-binding domain-containing protein [Dyadobacter psychrotolerans]|uniref:Phosphoenolpyruvate synthase n=1 Tax=Dyadobacter psychrotolerans TaxID=2541721 RepID=A0A4R5DPZ3_9BACT|nr:PEP/pyruvate-binding domain-containing protein [Dyadobacter psychrotolerans]TDE16329.1 phosphoenolpyruvate synthase [Dyadobacter psychrotolerans]
MNFISDSESEQAQNLTIGGKAKNLFLLKKMGMTIPKFAVIPWEVLSEMIPAQVLNGDQEKISVFIEQVQISDNMLSRLLSTFGPTEYFAVRSSAIDEDGSVFSFAGQFESYLFVPKENLAEHIKKVWISAFSPRVSDYRKHHNITGQRGIAIIIQEMIDTDVAGVAFGLNPVSGNKNEKLINAVFGLGEGLVSGELNADLFVLHGSEIKSELAFKTHKISFDARNKTGTILSEIQSEQQQQSTLSTKQIIVLGEVLDKLEAEFDQPQDIEFAFKDEILYLLQTRPITTLNLQNEKTGEYILWDNSNIIESYPGVTTPLTFSFISKSYETAYKLFSAYLGVSESVIRDNETVFSNTLGFINGRVYYNLKSWYHMLAMLPGYHINARYMEKMMGVKERFDVPETYRLSKGKAWWRIAKMAIRMLFRFLSLPRKRKEFMQLLDKTISEYKGINYDAKSAGELMLLYRNFEKSLLLEWKAPLLNDFFAMIWFGMLQKQCEQYFGDQNANIHNDLLCGSSDIISVEPVHRSVRLATRITASPVLKSLFISESEQSIQIKLGANTSSEFVTIKKEIDQYIQDFGERCVGELKLETISYTQDPSRFIRILKSYVETGITSDQFSGKRENAIRANAEKEVEQRLKGSLYKKWKLKRTLKTARELVSARENLRYERTRAFGIVRQLFFHIGKRFYAGNVIDQERDIFYLTKEEIFSFIEGTSVTQNIKALISLRKGEFESYQIQAPPAERFATYGAPYHANDFFNTDKVEAHQGDLKGIGCSPGKVSGRVRVVLNPNEVSSLNGDILVTSSTDPGWVTLFPGALGIIVERGSLLSHSAIVSREMGKPCIVSVTGLLKTLKTGDQIEMDGSTGTISIIQK